MVLLILKEKSCWTSKDVYTEVVINSSILSVCWLYFHRKHSSGDGARSMPITS